MPRKYFRRKPTFSEDREVGLVETVRIWFEACSLNVVRLFQYCDKVGPGSNGYKMILVVYEIPDEGSESGRLLTRLGFHCGVSRMSAYAKDKNGGLATPIGRTSNSCESRCPRAV